MSKRHTTGYVFDTATSDDGMTKINAARFHAFNPNGAVASLPKCEAFEIGDTYHIGAAALWSDLDNYFARAIRDYAKGKRFTRWALDYAVNRIAEDRAKAAAFLNEKREAKKRAMENR